MKTWTIVLIFLFTHSSFASEENSNGRVSYVSLDRVSIGLAKEMILRRIPLLQDIIIEQVSFSDTSTMEGFYNTRNASLVQYKDNTKTNSAKVLKGIRSPKVSDLSSVEATDSSMMIVDLDLESFSNCVKESYSLYERKKSISQSQNISRLSKRAQLKNINMLLDSTRGLAGEYDDEGMICSVYLGAKYKLFRSLIPSEFKVLSVYSKLNTSQMTTHLPYLFAMADIDSILSVDNQYRFLFKYLLVSSHMNSSASFPSLESLEKVYNQILSEQSTEYAQMENVVIKNNWVSISSELLKYTKNMGENL
jgi:hypothetical protein